ncbi:arsenic resistance protein, partial [Candidatus Bathyarchaeota archaeon]|nr:arsenic resistance protein [Candidatus Bathyarchaeota archaeon]
MEPERTTPVLGEKAPTPSVPSEKGERPQSAVDVENQAPTAQPAEEKEIQGFRGLGWLDRLLALWILLAMILGILLGNFVPSTGPTLQKGQFVGVSIPIAVGLLVMMYPILCKVKYESMHKLLQEREMWKQMAFSVVMNWIVAPFLMVSSDKLPNLPGVETYVLTHFKLALAWAFLPDEPELRVGLIIV